MKCFLKFLSILLVIVVSAFTFQAVGPGSIPWLGKSSNYFFLVSPSPPVAITKPFSLDFQPLKPLKFSPLKELLRDPFIWMNLYSLDLRSSKIQASLSIPYYYGTHIKNVIWDNKRKGKKEQMQQQQIVCFIEDHITIS